MSKEKSNMRKKHVTSVAVRKKMVASAATTLARQLRLLADCHELPSYSWYQMEVFPESGPVVIMACAMTPGTEIPQLKEGN